MADVGRVALPLIGVVGGFILGGPVGASIGLAIGTGLGYLFFPPEGKTIEGPRLDDLKVTFSSYGKPIPRIYGTMETGGNVVWSPGLVEHRKEEEVGGKGAPTTTSVSFLYTASFRINYSVGVAESILRNWADGKLIRDKTGTGSVSLYFDTDAPGDLAIRDFLGTTTQLPGPAEQADKGIANTPAYRGTVGQEWEDMPLEDFGNRIPQLTGEIAMSATDPFDFKRVTPGVAILTQTASYSPDNTTVYVGNNNASVNRIDFVSQTVIANIVYLGGAGEVFEVDQFDRFWGKINNSNISFRLYEASTAELLASSGSGVLWNSAVDMRAFILLDDGNNGGIGVSLTGNLCQVAFNSVSSEIDHLRDHNDTSPYALNTFFPGTYSFGLTHQWVLDSNGDPWLTCNKDSDGSITRFDRVSGTPVEQVVLTTTLVTRITYYEADNAFILQNGNNIIKYSLDSMSIVDTLAATIVSGSRNNAIWEVIDDRLYVQEAATGDGGVYDVSLDTLSRIEDFTPNDWVGGISNLEAYLYDPISDAIIVTGTTGAETDNYIWLFLNRATGDVVTVRSIVEDVSSLVDYTAGTDIDATELTDTLPGYMIRSRMTARKALEPLATAFNFRSVESDFKIKFPKRGKASVGNIPQIDLGATAGELPTTQAVLKTRIPEEQLFETAIIEYIDPTFDNNPNTQQAKRVKEAIDVGGSIKFDFPGALGNNQAAQIIERILFQAWSGRTNISTSVPLKHILKDPGDVVTITKDGKTVQVELHDVRLGANSIIKLEGTIDDSAVHTSVATGSTADGEEGQTITIPGSTEFFILDTSLMRDEDEGEGVYVGAGTPEGTSWPGAAIFRGLDTVSINPFVGISSSRNLDYGFATTVLATFSPDIWDRTNSVTISLTSGALSSDTEINVLNGANTLLIGSEIVQFATAVLNASGTYTISTLLRGRRGTDGFSGSHVINEKVIVLSSATLLRVDVDLSSHTSTFFYRAMTLGSSQFSSKTIEQVLTLRSQMPYSPSHVAGTRPVNDWTFTHIRRTRVGGAWRDFVDVPLSETSEAYEWDILDGSTVKRLLTSSTESVTYTEAQQITDFGSVQDSVDFNVYQISGTVGRGFATNATVEV
jgi:hypothetical protein